MIKMCMQLCKFGFKRMSIHIQILHYGERGQIAKIIFCR